jgi:hypothetical protein
MLIFFVGIIHLSIASRLTGFKSRQAETAETQPGVSIWIVAYVLRALLFYLPDAVRVSSPRESLAKADRVENHCMI